MFRYRNRAEITQFLCVNRSPIWYGFRRADARAIRYSCVDTSQPPPPGHILKRTQDSIELNEWTNFNYGVVDYASGRNEGPNRSLLPQAPAGRGGTPYDGLCREAPSRKGYLFQAWSIRKGREICHLLLWKGPKRLTDGFYGFIKSRKHYILWWIPI